MGYRKRNVLFKMATTTHSTLEEKVQLKRVFKLLALDIPKQMLERKIKVYKTTSNI